MTTSPSTPVAVACEHGLYSHGQSIADKFGLPLTDRLHPAGLSLYLGTTRLDLRVLAPDAPGPVFVDYCAGSSDDRRRHGGGKNRPLPPAVGLGKLSAPS